MPFLCGQILFCKATPLMKGPVVSTVVLLLLLLSAGQTAMAQKQGKALIDSMLVELPAMKDDTVKVKALQRVSNAYRSMDTDEGIRYGHLCVELAEKLGNRASLAACHNCLGNNHKARSDYPKALDAYERARSLYEDLGQRRPLAVILMNIGTVYRALQRPEKALEFYDRSFAIAKETDNLQLQGQLLGNKGVIYFAQEKWEEQRKVSEQALVIFESINDVSNTAWIVSNLADGRAMSGDLESALVYQEKAIGLYQQVGDLLGIAGTYGNMGSVHAELAEAETDPAERKRHFEAAISYLQKAEVLQRQLGDLDYLKDVFNNLSEIYVKTGDHKLALDAYRAYVQLKDSVHSLEVQESIANLETRRALEVRDKEIIIQQLKKRTELIYMSGGVAILLLIVVFAIIGYRRQKASNRLLNVEKQKSEDLLHNILPEETAKELKDKGHSDARLMDQVTVLFTDFKGFTAMSEQLSPKQLVKDLHECFSQFDHICEKHGIEKIKTIGDAYMAAGGLPTPNSTHATDVVKAALEMAQVVEEGKAKKIAAGLPYFEIRIGVHTGPVVAGIVGIKKFQYDIWGDTVNTASRMESSGEVGRVNISQATYELVKDQFTCEFRGEVEAKGKGKMGMWFAS
ncbi:MAG: tetratricopeptide repeat protein [Flavobacteriales bacterium]|nr:tetratricopeptide repeat protein [Flavobacteriales bacterium]